GTVTTTRTRIGVAATARGIPTVLLLGQGLSGGDDDHNWGPAFNDDYDKEGVPPCRTWRRPKLGAYVRYLLGGQTT
ncbi:unnamed protein product, partial [Ectocarpus sp. 4 AP-2014]